MSKRKRRRFIATATFALITITVLTAVVFLLIPFSLKYIRLNLGDNAFSKGNYGKSATLFTKVFDKYPGNERAKDGVLASYETLINRELEHADYETAYGFAMELDDTLKGRAGARTIYSECANSFADSLLADGRYTLAYEIYSEAMERDTLIEGYEAILGYHFLVEAQTAETDGDYSQAIENVKTALNYLYDNGAVTDIIKKYYLEWARTSLNENNLEKALSILNEMTWEGLTGPERDKLLLETEIALAHFYLNESDRVMAKAFVERALLIDASNEELINLYNQLQ